MSRINLCMVGAECYRILHRIPSCPRCGAAPGDRCLGRDQLGRKHPGEFAHVDRKAKFREWRRQSPAIYRIVRDAIAKHLVDGRPVKLPAYLVLVDIREAVERAAAPRKPMNPAQ